MQPYEPDALPLTALDWRRLLRDVWAWIMGDTP